MKNLFANIAAKQLYCNSVFGTIKKQIWAVSSAGSERLPYKQDVGGSNPSLPTKASIKRGFFSTTDCLYAEVAEPADALDSKSCGLNIRVGSTPTFCTKNGLKSCISSRFYFYISDEHVLNATH